MHLLFYSYVIRNAEISAFSRLPDQSINARGINFPFARILVIQRSTISVRIRERQGKIRADNPNRRNDAPLYPLIPRALDAHDDRIK